MYALSVVIATGGYAANGELLAEFVPGAHKNMGFTTFPGATGDGIIMAQAIGAELVFMDCVSMHLGHKGVPVAESHTIFVNSKGERFINETAETKELIAAINGLPEGQCYMIFDDASAGELAADARALTQASAMYSGETIQALAETLGIDATALKASIEAYNTAYKANSRDTFGRETFDANIAQAPFYAVPRKVNAHMSYGGINTNVDAQVVKPGGDPIANLYAAGETVGGIHGTSGVGGNFVAEALAFGRIAGANAAKNAK